jgi:hypothetical protein
VETKSSSASQASSGQVVQEHFRSINQAVVATAAAAVTVLSRRLRGNDRFALAGN